MVHELMEFEKGVILINKPVGITSFGVVAGVRRYLLSQGGSTNEGSRVQGFKSLKVGHTGTLDSMASGLLIVLVGGATKRQGDFTRLPKEYEGEFALGVESDTYSADGRLRFFAEQGARRAVPLHAIDTPSPGGRGKGEGVLSGVALPSLPPFPPSSGGREISLKRLASITRAQMEGVFKKFQGEQEQTVPPFSAVQVKGQRLHRLARRGRPLPELPRRRINVEYLELLDFCSIAYVGARHTVSPPNPEEFLNIAPKIRFRACVSSGTYVRSLVVDIGKELGTGAVLTQLTRTGIGPYKLSDAIDLPVSK